MTLLKAFRSGTDRLVSPEVTLQRITPHLAKLGITRLADLTGMDRLGIPTYSISRPRGRSIGTAFGKGVSHINAKVSAVMEAVERSLSEQWTGPCLRTSRAELLRSGKRVAPFERFETFKSNQYVHDERVIAWVEATEILSQEEAWVPACAVYFSKPALHSYSSNGLASGNHIAEATLHALYEVLERDTLSHLLEDGRLNFDLCDIMDKASLPSSAKFLVEAIVGAGLQLIVLRPRSEMAVHTFMTVLLDPLTRGQPSSFATGFGAHLSPDIALTRALTEAAQSRIREDVHEPQAPAAKDERLVHLYDTFAQLSPDADFAQCEDGSEEDLEQDLERVLRDLRDNGFDSAYRVVLPTPDLPVSVVKCLVPGALSTFPM